MEFYNLFKSFFGIPNSVPPKDFRFEETYHYPDNYNQRDEEDEDVRGNWGNFMNDPQEFHKFVEEQMHHLMSVFGLGHGESPFGEAFRSQKALPASPSALRDQYLKPGFEHPSTSKTDTDMDGNVNIEELDTVLKPTQEMTPYVRPKVESHFFGQSMSTRTVVKPDGTVETTRTTQDNQGNRETTVIRRDQDIEHTVTTRIDASGVETKEEKFVRLTPDEGNPNLPFLKDQQPSPPSWFDSFLK